MALKSSFTSSARSKGGGFFLFLLCLAAVLAVLFHASFHPDKVIFSNDGPLGITSSKAYTLPDILTGAWSDLNWLGFNGGAAPPNLSNALLMLLGPLGVAKFLAPISVFFLGICAWVFFSRLGFSAGPAALGGIAMALNSNVFSNVCWGLCSRALTVGLFFLAMAVLIPGVTRLMWVRIILSGLCIGMAVMEGADNGVIFSLYLSAFILFQAWNQPGKAIGRLTKGALTVAVVAVFAGLIATQSIISLYGFAIKNAAGVSTSTDSVRSKAENWDWATQWSLPKAELLRVIIPGLYGYRMDTENGGNYWGAVGRTPGWEQGRPGYPRHSGAGEYAGVLVVLIAIWTIAQAARRDASIYTPLERRWIWFWVIVAVVSILLAVGRHAPFYRIIYALPYFSSIRNPMKFMHPCHVSMVILFAYGMQGMVRRYFAIAPAAKPRSAAPANASWRAPLPGFEKKWIGGSIIGFVLTLLGWTRYSNASGKLQSYVETVGFPNESNTRGLAEAVAKFSITEVGWFVLFLALAVALLVMVIKGSFAGHRSKLGWALLGLLLIADLGRANKPWIKTVDYKDKYASNPLLDVLRQKPHEHRVTLLRGFGPTRDLQLFHKWLEDAYGGDWTQLLFPYFNIQCLDVTQLSRPPEEYVQFEQNTFGLTSPERLRIQKRHWQLTNTRYLLGLAPYLGAASETIGVQLKPHSRYELAAKPGVAQPRTFDDLVPAPKEDGPIALFEVPAALPRAKLYAQWQVMTNDQETLAKLAEETFDPQTTVLLSEPLAAVQASAATNSGAGSVETTRYAPKRRELKVTAGASSILLVNDKYDPDCKVRVNGREERLLRVNYLMRGVFLPPGQHTVVFSFEPPIKGVYVSLAGVVLGVLLGLLLLLAALRKQPKPA